MSSIFKISCGFYWVVWYKTFTELSPAFSHVVLKLLICLSYAMGIGVFETRYVIHTPKYEYVSLLIKSLCLVNAGMSFVGCVFVKCDITHILCCLCFVIPLGFGVPGACIFGITATKELIAHPPTIKQTTEIVKMYIQNHKGEDRGYMTPGWLRKTEEDYHCCGIRGVMDYMHFNYKNITGYDVPRSCCRRRDVECATKFTPGIRMLIHREAAQRGHLHLDEHDSHVNKSLHYNDSDELLLNTRAESPLDVHEFINRTGCFEFLLTNTKDTYDAHSAIYILILICSLLMSFIYMQNFCTYGPCRDEAYLHSLDTEELPYMEVKDAVNIPATPNQSIITTNEDLVSVPQTPLPPPTPPRHSSIALEYSKNPSLNYKRLSLSVEKAKKTSNKPANLPPSVADSLTHKRLRKYM